MKEALKADLIKRSIGDGRIASIDIRSAGERYLAKPTADNVKEPLNRRVEINVKFEGLPTAVSTEPIKPSSGAEAQTREKRKRLNLNLPPDYEPKKETMWEKMERERKIIEEFDRTHPRRHKNLTDVLVEAATKVLEPIIKSLPGGLRDKAREGIRKAIESGTEKGCEAAIDASDVTGEKAEAMKAACKAALKVRLGEKR